MDESSASVTATQPSRAALVLAVDGVIDAASSAEVGARLRAAVSALPPPPLVVIDLSRVEFFAAAGVHLLIDVADVCARRGLRVRLVVAPESVVARVVDIATVDGLPTYPTLAEALRDQPQDSAGPRR